ncbi:MAG: hypothetical protein ACJAYI_001806, partial [Myxococcota bacterium]
SRDEGDNEAQQSKVRKNAIPTLPFLILFPVR